MRKGIGVFVAVVVTLGGCSGSRPEVDEAVAEVEVAVAERAPTPGERALAYAPGRNPTDLRIAAAQERVRAQRDEADRWVALATLLIRRKRETSDPALLRTAEDAVRAALAIDADNTFARTLEAMLLQEDHRFAEARDAARELIAAKPEDTTGHLVLGDALLELGDFEGAAASYQTAMDLRPDLRVYERGAHLRWLSGDVEGAIELYGLAIDAGSVRDPESTAWCWVELGEVYRRSGRPAQAASAAEKALELVPDYLPATRLQARVLAATGRRDEAIAAMSAAVARRPLVEDRLELADWLVLEGRDAEAREQIAAAERERRDDPRALASWYARHDRSHDEALRLARLEVAARRGLLSHDAHALALARAGRTAEARRAMDAATALGTVDARLMLHDALIDLAAGDTAGARASLDRAEALEPEADPILEAELRSRLGGAS